MYITSQNVHTSLIESKFIKYFKQFKRKGVGKKSLLLDLCRQLNISVLHSCQMSELKNVPLELYVTTRLKTLTDNSWSVTAAQYEQDIYNKMLKI